MPKHTIREQLTQEFSAAVAAVLGDLGELHEDVKERLFVEDIDDIVRKMKWYIWG